MKIQGEEKFLSVFISRNNHFNYYVSEIAFQHYKMKEKYRNKVEKIIHVTIGVLLIKLDSVRGGGEERYACLRML